MSLALNSKTERHAAEAFEIKGRASIHGDICWIAVDKIQTIFRQAIVAHGGEY